MLEIVFKESNIIDISSLFEEIEIYQFGVCMMIMVRVTMGHVQAPTKFTYDYPFKLVSPPNVGYVVNSSTSDIDTG